MGAYLTNTKHKFLYPDARVLVFSKAPVPGIAKTRLSGALGARGAANLHASLVRRLLAMLDTSALSPVHLWCAPDCRHPFFTACRRDFSVHLKSQGQGDLGQKMHRAFQATLKVSPYALLVGTDAPELTCDVLNNALSALRGGKDAVFVPALDGGYALVGLRKPARELFSGISWGGAGVMNQTRKRLQKSHLDWLELPACGDLDTPKDLKRMKREGVLLF